MSLKYLYQVIDPFGEINHFHKLTGRGSAGVPHSKGLTVHQSGGSPYIFNAGVKTFRAIIKLIQTFNFDSVQLDWSLRISIATGIIGKKNEHDLLTSATAKVANIEIADEVINKNERIDNLLFNSTNIAEIGIIQSHLKPKKTTTSKLNQLEGFSILKYPLKVSTS